MKLIPSIAALLLLLVGLSLADAQAPGDCAAVVPSNDVDRKLDQIQQMRKAGQFDAAEKAVEPLVQRYPGTFRVLYISALIESDKKNWSNAEQSLQAAIDLQNKCATAPGFKADYTVYNTLGWLQMTQGHWLQAESSYKLALQHSTDLTAVSIARTQSNLGYLYFSKGDFANARTFLSAAAQGGNANAAKTLTAVQQAETIYQSAREQVATPK